MNLITKGFMKRETQKKNQNFDEKSISDEEVEQHDAQSNIKQEKGIIFGKKKKRKIFFFKLLFSLSIYQSF